MGSVCSALGGVLVKSGALVLQAGVRVCLALPVSWFVAVVSMLVVHWEQSNARVVSGRAMQTRRGR